MAEAVELILKAKRPILLVGDAVRELALKMNCPVIQTSGGTSYIRGLEDRTFQYVFSDASIARLTCRWWVTSARWCRN